ncbi:hypothetical protein [Humibacter antri]
MPTTNRCADRERVADRVRRADGIRRALGIHSHDVVARGKMGGWSPKPH